MSSANLQKNPVIHGILPNATPLGHEGEHSDGDHS